MLNLDYENLKLISVQLIELRGIEELPQRYTKAVTKFLDGYSAGILALAE